MRSLAFKTAIICATVWIFLKYMIFISEKSIEWFNIAMMANNFLLLSTIAVSIFLTKKSLGFNMGKKRDDLKTGIFAGMVYTLLVVGFNYYYNLKIDSAVLEDRVAQRILVLEDVISTDQGLAEYQERSPQAKSLDREAIVNKERQAARSFLNPKVAGLLMLMFFTLLVIFYAFFITLVIHKIYLKGIPKA